MKQSSSLESIGNVNALSSHRAPNTHAIHQNNTSFISNHSSVHSVLSTDRAGIGGLCADALAYGTMSNSKANRSNISALSGSFYDRASALHDPQQFFLHTNASIFERNPFQDFTNGKIKDLL